MAGRRSRSGGRGIRCFLPTAGETDRIFGPNHQINRTENGSRLDRPRSIAFFFASASRVRREIYIDTRVKTVVLLPIAAQIPILTRYDSREIGSQESLGNVQFYQPWSSLSGVKRKFQSLLGILIWDCWEYYWCDRNCKERLKKYPEKWMQSWKTSIREITNMWLCRVIKRREHMQI